MKRKTFLIQILVLLFTFQNIWSVAEAACLHEMPNIPNSMLSSPIALDEKSDSPSQALYSLENYKEIYDYCQKVCFNEKCSHFSNTIVIQIEPPDDWYTLNYNYQTREEAKADIIKYIKLFYNHRRIQKGWGFKTPNQMAEDFYKLAA